MTARVAAVAPAGAGQAPDAHGTIALVLAFVAAWSLFAYAVLLSPLNAMLVEALGARPWALLFTLLKLPVWIVPVLAALRWARVGDVPALLGLRPPQVAGIAVGLVLGAAWFAAQAALVSDRAPAWPSAAAVALGLVTPLVEEFFFRGAVLGVLLRRWRFLAANAAQAVLFLAIHLPWWLLGGVAPGAVAQRALYIVAFGFFLGWLRCRTGGLLAPVLVHWANNLGGRL